MEGNAVLELLEGVRGDIVTEGHPAYDEARAVHNGMFDRRPLAVLRARDVGDVRAAVRAARESGLDLAIRAGGHSAPGFGTCDGGIVLDLSGMKGVHVDPDRRVAVVQTGCTWGDLDHATHTFGLATTGGIISTTGVAGLTLGGGIGYLARAHGLSLDNLRRADVVLADGSFVTASEEEHPDLFWALRGGGGNFGVVTSMEFDLHEVDTVYGGPIFFDLDDTEDVLRGFREFIAHAPRTMGGFPGFHLAPPLPFIPADRVGRPHVVAVTCFNGPDHEAEALLKPLRDSGRIAAEHVGRMPYPALNSAFDALVPPGLQHYWKSVFTPELNDEAIAAHAEHGARVPSLNTAVHLYPIDGAVHDVAPEATAFAYRDASFATVVAGMWESPDDNADNIRWVRDYFEALEPHSSPGAYINFRAEDDQPRVADDYAGNYDRLRRVKREYDPDNLFHLNQNIAPAD